MSDDAQTFRTVLGVQATGRREIAVPFHPAEVWGRRDRYHVTGTIDGNPVRGPLSSVAGGWVLPVGALWYQDPRVTEPTEVAAELRFEGPQRDHLADDVAEALAAHPDAAAFWDSLATFSRKGYLRWTDATKRRPELRAARIAEMIALLRGGHKQRPGARTRRENSPGSASGRSGRTLRAARRYVRLRNLSPNAANTRTMPTFTSRRSQKWSLNKRTSTPTRTATNPARRARRLPVCP